MKFLFVFVMALFTLSVYAYVAPTQKDIRLASQSVLENQNFGAPIVTTTNYIKTAYAGPTSAAAVTLSSFSHQPDVPRNLTITPGSTTGDVEACIVTVAGTNIFGRSISETFTFLANASSAVVGTKAFKSVSSVTWPADCESGAFEASWIIGVGEKLGLKRCMDFAGDWAWSTIDGVYESTRATVVADADEVEKNTADFNGTMDASAVFRGRFVQNFRCLP